VHSLRTVNIQHNICELLLLADDILGSSKALWTSPDDTFVAYIQFNDSGVPTAHIPLYSDPDNIYARFTHIPYPKVSEQLINLYLLQQGAPKK